MNWLELAAKVGAIPFGTGIDYGVHFSMHKILQAFNMTNDDKNKTKVAHWHRYIKSIYRYGTLKKHINLFKLFFYYKTEREKVPTMPSFLKVEISRQCHVNCLWCEKEKDNIFFVLDNYKNLIDKTKDYIYLVSLYDIGEPLLNNELLYYIQYNSEKMIGTAISTSLSIEKKDNYWKELVSSGLTLLIVAIDGITTKTYNKYRRNGDLELVMKNLKKILFYKSKYNNNLTVEWQMLDLPWNKHEQEEARRKSNYMGCDLFHLKKEENTIRLTYKKKGITRKRNCFLPYIIFIVDAYNRARPCFKIYTEDVYIGNLDSETFEEIWNGDEIAKIRNRKKICERSPCMTCIE